ncbi:hypothetical protein Ct9H90mP29_13880 [bacterium]|nr:MAG: hypothetical protein Ct9H90mP29_13880 [bacterium]
MVKVDLVKADTTLFLDSLAFNWRGNDIHVDGLKFQRRAELLIRTDSRKYGGILIYQPILFMINSKKIFSTYRNNKNLRNVKFSPDGKRVAYVRQDNNLYMHDFESGRERKLTTTGSGTVSNGHFGWLYEEELTGYDGYRWSPNGNLSPIGKKMSLWFQNSQ